MKSLTMKMVGKALKFHKSTSAHVVANKYLNSPRGIFLLRTFFTEKYVYVSEEVKDMSAKTVKEAIVDLVNGENKLQPFTDHQLSFLLKEKGITCVRRTIAKYRKFLQIGNTHQRKRFV